MPEIAFLKCKLETGLFPDESTVVIETSGAEEVSFFCPTEFIRLEKLKVVILERGELESLIKIPAESAVGSTFVVANTSLLQEQRV